MVSVRRFLVAIAPCHRVSRASTERGGYSTCPLRKWNAADFAFIRPVFRRFHETSTNRIVPGVIPFLCIAFVAAQQMIEKVLLPVRLLNSHVQQLFAHYISQCLDPISQGNPVYRKAANR